MKSAKADRPAGKAASNGRGAAKRQVTLKDIAQEVGVSINAVSSVLNPRRARVKVSDATRKAILQSARRMNYRRNVAASRLAGGVTRTLGILMARMGSPYDGPLASGFEQEAARRGYQCFVGCLHYEGLRPGEYIDRFLGHGVEGLLLCTVWNDAHMKDALRGVLEADMPVVFVDYGWEGVEAPLVCGNHEMGGRLIGRHLIETGHRCIGLFMYESAPCVSSVVQRAAGVRAVAEEHGGVEVRDVTVPSGSRKQVGTRLARLLAQQPDLTALVCQNDVDAQTVILSLNSCGLSVPDDIAVTGYDDLLAALAEEIGMAEHESDRLLSTPLTTVRQPLRRIGIEAADLLIRWVQDGVVDRAETRALDVELVVRSSSRLPLRVERKESWT